MFSWRSRRGESYRPRQPEQTVLYQVVAEHLETFLARQRQEDRHVPRFVEREFRKFMECGIPSYGFLRLRCDRCRQEKIVSFSCKGRAFCPSCCGRRMADTAAHLVDRVIPHVPVRQWVLSLPYVERSWTGRGADSEQRKKHGACLLGSKKTRIVRELRQIPGSIPRVISIASLSQTWCLRS